MADITTITFVYPPNFTGTYTGTQKGVRRYIVNCTNYSDSTGEADAIKLKRTDLRNSDGKIPKKLIIEKIEYDISGMTVYIDYNNTNSDRVCVLYGSAGVLDFTASGGFVPTYDDADGDTGVGDITFTTANETAADSYNITLTVRLSGE